MEDIRKLTEGYVAAFDACDIDKLATYMAAEFELTDPEVTELTPKNSVLSYINKLFEAHENLNFQPHSILVDGDLSAVHFTLTLGTNVIDGVDVIKWKSGLMIKMEAYLTPRT